MKILWILTQKGESSAGYLAEEIGITPGQVSNDGKFSLEEVECLGHCGTAPVVQINGEFHEEMDLDKLKALLATFE